MQFPASWEKQKFPKDGSAPSSKIKLGLDLQGGMHLVLKVDHDKGCGEQDQRIAADLKTQMINDRIHYSKAGSVST